MSDAIVPTLVTINNGEPGVQYAIVPRYGGDYAIGGDGSIWSCIKLGGQTRMRTNEWRRLKTYRPGRYFLATILCDGKYRPYPVHRLVLEAWHGPPPTDNPDALTRHLDGNGANNRPTNLAWGTQSENMLDRGLHGDPTFRGEGHPQSVLTDEIVVALRNEVSGGKTVEAACIILGIGDNVQAAYQAVRGRNWAHLPGAVPSKYKTATKEQKQHIRDLDAQGLSLHEIISETGYTYLTVYNQTIRRKRRAGKSE